MTEVQLSPNDRDDILELLDYALEKKLEEEPTRYGKYKWDNRGYYKLRIPQLKRLIRGEKPTLPPTQAITLLFACNGQPKEARPKEKGHIERDRYDLVLLFNCISLKWEVSMYAILFDIFIIPRLNK